MMDVIKQNMINLHYRVYYEYNGPTKAEPFRQPKSEEQIAFALSRVKLELGIMLNDDDAEILVDDRALKQTFIVITVKTSCTERAALAALTRCLQGLDLYGERLW